MPNIESVVRQINRQRASRQSGRPRFHEGELNALGTWQDPERVSNDQRADNVLLEVEFGEVEGEQVGDGIVRALRLINDLEINEQILCARMVNIEQTTPIT